ncbi:YbfB/YjiJ family MFS transporter [Streptomyces sp. NPDC020917]|uniref:YbfB/YjiJ family MFS transporter n=1 Tax=Streptomyces sp. NPDC020917 TaxID=3365102 RepID=UPI0037B0BF66
MGVGRFVFTPIIPLMQAQAGLSAGAGAHLATANYAGYLAGALAGILAPALVRSPAVLRASLLVLTGTLAAMPATHSTTAWLVLRLLAGIASALIFVIAVTSLHSHLRAHPAHLPGWAFGGVGAGIALSGLLVLALHSAAGWRAAWWASAALAAALSAAAWSLRPEPAPAPNEPVREPAPPGGGAVPRQGTSRDGDGAPAVSPGRSAGQVSVGGSERCGGAAGAGRGRVGVGRGFRSAGQVSVGGSQRSGGATGAGRGRVGAGRWFSVLFASYTLEGVGYIVAGTFLVAAIGQSSPGWIGSGAWVLVGLAAVPSSACWSWLGRRYARADLLLVALVIQAAGIALPALTGGVTAALVSAVLFGGTFIGISTLALAAGAELRFPRSVALLTAGYSVGQILGPLVVTPMLHHGYHRALILASVVVLAAAGAAAVLRSGSARAAAVRMQAADPLAWSAVSAPEQSAAASTRAS